jgi:hypothetical protein
MKILSPRFSVTFQAKLTLLEVADIISKRIAPGGTWSLDKSGYYEEVPALRMSPIMLGMSLSLVEQQPSELYMLVGNFVGARRDVERERIDISSAIRLLIKEETAFELEPLPDAPER